METKEKSLDIIATLEAIAEDLRACATSDTLNVSEVCAELEKIARKALRDAKCEGDALTLEQAIDSFPVLEGFRDGTAYTGTSPRRLYIDNPETFTNYAARRGSGAHRCAQFLCSLCGFNVGQFNLSNLRAKLDSEHARAAVAILGRYMQKGGF